MNLSETAYEMLAKAGVEVVEISAGYRVAMPVVRRLVDQSRPLADKLAAARIQVIRLRPVEVCRPADLDEEDIADEDGEIVDDRVWRLEWLHGDEHLTSYVRQP